MAVEHAGVIALVLGDGIVTVPVVGDAGEEAGEVAVQRGQVTGHQGVIEPAHRFTRLARIARQGLDQDIVEGARHLEVGIAQGVLQAGADLPLAVEG